MFLMPIFVLFQELRTRGIQTASPSGCDTTTIPVANRHSFLWKICWGVGGKVSCPERSGNASCRGNARSPVCLVCLQVPVCFSTVYLCVSIFGTTQVLKQSTHTSVTLGRGRSKGHISSAPPLAARSPKLGRAIGSLRATH